MLDIATSNGIEKALIVAQEILINNELQKKSDELKASVLASENLHLKDLLAFAIEKASNTEQQLKISNEQIVTLKEELRDASQELKSYHQELDTCHKEMATLTKEAQELLWVK
jgi:two-component system CheB/CheR fusion protein